MKRAGVRAPACLAVLLLWFLVADAKALGLGELRSASALNQPFAGEIDLIAVPADELDTLSARIASADDFAKAGVERLHFLTQLVFTPGLSPRGAPVLRVSSREPIKEPFLDFLVEVVWPGGRLVRGFTVLLDPPSDGGRTAVTAPASRPAVPGDAPGRPVRQAPIAPLPPAPAPSPRAEVTPPASQLPVPGVISDRAAGPAPPLSTLADAGVDASVPAQDEAALLALRQAEALQARLAALESELAETQALLELRELERQGLGERDEFRDVLQGGEAGTSAESGVSDQVSLSQAAQGQTTDSGVSARAPPQSTAVEEGILDLTEAAAPAAEGATLGDVAFGGPRPGPGGEAESSPPATTAPGALSARPESSGEGVVSAPAVSEAPAPGAAPPSRPPSARPAPPSVPPIAVQPSLWDDFMVPISAILGVILLSLVGFGGRLLWRRHQAARALQTEGALGQAGLEPPSDLGPPSHLGARPLTQPESALVALAPKASGLTRFDGETEEADAVSEADIYIAYGRLKEAEELLRQELQRSPDRHEALFKLAEVFAGSGPERIADLLAIMEELRGKGADGADPARWEQLKAIAVVVQRGGIWDPSGVLSMTRDLSPVEPEPEPRDIAPPAATDRGGERADARGARAEVSATPGRGALRTPTHEPEAERAVAAAGAQTPLPAAAASRVSEERTARARDLPEGPAPRASHAETELPLVAPSAQVDEDAVRHAEDFLDSLAESLLLGPADAPLVLPPEPGIAEPVRTSGPTDAAPETADGEELILTLDDLGDLSALDLGDPGAFDQAAQAPPRTPPAPAVDIRGPESDDLMSLPSLDLGAFQDEPGPHDSLTYTSISAPRLRVSEGRGLTEESSAIGWLADSSIWDENATKLDLARAYLDMDDAASAREILEEVIAEGREEQKREAHELLASLG